MGARGRYYEQTGALRDMVQNHLTQLLTLTAMEVPVTFEPEAIRTEKAKVLQAVTPVRPEDVIYGQYTRESGWQAGAGVPEEPGVPPDSVTETFVALKLGIENWRWGGVPFLSGHRKALPAKFTQIAVTSAARRSGSSQRCTLPAAPMSCLHSAAGMKAFDLHFQVKAPGSPWI